MFEQDERLTPLCVIRKATSLGSSVVLLLFRTCLVTLPSFEPLKTVIDSGSVMLGAACSCSDS
jgi:hypothetical protein